MSDESALIRNFLRKESVRVESEFLNIKDLFSWPFYQLPLEVSEFYEIEDFFEACDEKIYFN